MQSTRSRHTLKNISLSAALFFAGVCVLADETATTLVITSPTTLQVFQRTADDQADVIIQGTLSEPADAVEAKAELLEGATRGKQTEWVLIADKDDLSSGTFAGKLSLQAGGWYTITVRAQKSAQIVAQTTIDKTGVGEVFVTAGQSNSANFGTPKQKAEDDRVVYFDGKLYLPAQDPIPGGCGGGGSPWSILGDLIASAEAVPVCFRSASLTWTEVKSWLPPDNGLYKNLVKCVKPFGPNGVRAVLWHQGESDTLVDTKAAIYCERLQIIIETLGQDCGYPLPWFVAQASFHPGSQAPQQNQVAQGQRMAWDKKVAWEGPVTDDLLGEKYRSDGVHFNQAGLDAHAQRWFGSLKKHYGWKNAKSRAGGAGHVVEQAE